MHPLQEQGAELGASAEPGLTRPMNPEEALGTCSKIMWLLAFFTRGTVTQRRSEGEVPKAPGPRRPLCPPLSPARSCRNLRTQADAHHVSSRMGREPEAAEWSPVLLQAEGPVEDQP